MPRPRARRTRPLRSTVGQRGLRPEVLRATSRATPRGQPTQPSRNRRTQPHDVRAQSWGASNASISGGTSYAAGWPGLRGAVTVENSRRAFDAIDAAVASR